MSDYQQLYADAGQQYGVDPFMVQAIAQQESGENPDALSSKGAGGVMQLMPGTAKDLGVRNVNDPAESVPAGAHYYSQHYNKYNDPNLALMAYNWGPANVDNWIANGANPDVVPDETKKYVANVTQKYSKLKNGKPVTMAQNQSDDPVIQALTADYPEDHIDKNLPTAPNQPSVDPIVAALTADYPEDHVQYPNNAKEKWLKEAGSTDPNAGAIEDIAKSIPSAVVRGVGAIPQIPAYAGNLAAQTENYLYKKAHNLLSNTPLTPQQEQLLNDQPFYTGNTLPDALIQAGNSIIGNEAKPNPLSGNLLHNPQTTPGRLVSAGIEGALAGPATGTVGPIKSALSAVGGAGGNELYPGNPIATLAGGAIAPGAAKLGDMVAGNVSPEMAQIAKQAQDRGINIPPGLMAQSPLMNRMYSLTNRLGFTHDNTHEQFTKAVANNILGLPDETKLTNPVMADAKANIGKMYERVAKLSEQNGGTPISDTTLNAINDMRGNSVEASPFIEKFFNKLTDALGSDDKLTSESYKKLTQTGSVIDNMQKSTKPEVKIAGQQLEKLLQNDLANGAGPEAKNLLQQADQKYALWHLADAARDDTTGMINPTKFSSEAWKRNSNYFRTAQNLNNPSETYTLSNIADKLKLTPSSGTAENLLLERLAGLGGSSLLGQSVFGGPGAVGGALGGYALGKGVGSALSSNWYRNYLINKATGGAP